MDGGQGGGEGRLTIGSVTIEPKARLLAASNNRIRIEPRMMSVLLALHGRAGEVVSRAELIERCWSGAAVGDDSINRAISGIRRALRKIGVHDVAVETISAAGYSLVSSEALPEASGGLDAELSAAMEAARASWRMSLPQPDMPTIGALRIAAARSGGDPEILGMLALLLRHAVEHAPAEMIADLIAECSATAERALRQDPAQGSARAALIGMWPIFGEWSSRREQLLAALAASTGNDALEHELAILEMATGRTRAAEPIVAGLLEREPLAPVLHYKRIYHLWSLERLSEMDRFADRAMQIWPRYPAIWLARLWSLAFTGRPLQARQQIADASSRPAMPQPVVEQLAASVASLCEDGAGASARAIEVNLAAAQRGPAQCLQALIFLSGIGALDEAFAVAEGYYLRRGAVAVAVRRTASDPSINDQHRRVTQALFIPSGTALLKDPRFLTLCEQIGLVEYWNHADVRPDFML